MNPSTELTSKAVEQFVATMQQCVSTINQLLTLCRLLTYQQQQDALRAEQAMAVGREPPEVVAHDPALMVEMAKRADALRSEFLEWIPAICTRINEFSRDFAAASPLYSIADAISLIDLTNPKPAAIADAAVQLQLNEPIAKARNLITGLRLSLVFQEGRKNQPVRKQK